MPIKALLLDFDGVLVNSESCHIKAWDIATKNILKLELSADYLNSLRGKSSMPRDAFEHVFIANRRLFKKII